MNYEFGNRGPDGAQEVVAADAPVPTYFEDTWR